MATYLDLFRYRELFGSLFRRDLRAKYKGSVLGLAWSLAHPVVLMLVYLLVFSVMLKIQTADYEHYWLFLLAGLPAWVFFATALQAASPLAFWWLDTALVYAMGLVLIYMSNRTINLAHGELGAFAVAMIILYAR